MFVVDLHLVASGTADLAEQLAPLLDQFLVQHEPFGLLLRLGGDCGFGGLGDELVNRLTGQGRAFDVGFEGPFAAALEVVDTDRVESLGESDSTFAHGMRMGAVGIGDLLAIDVQGAPIIGADAEVVTTVAFDPQHPGIADPEAAGLLGDGQIEAARLAFVRRRQLVEVRELVPVPFVRLEGHVRGLRQCGGVVLPDLFSDQVISDVSELLIVERHRGHTTRGAGCVRVLEELDQAGDRVLLLDLAEGNRRRVRDSH